MFYSFFSSALVFFNNVPAVFGDFLSKIGFSKAFSYRLKQLLGVFYHDGAVVGQERVNGLGEVESVWAENSAFPKCGGLGHIGPPHWYEGASDENYCSQGVGFS